MSSESRPDSAKQSAPIPINTSGHHARNRSGSISSGLSFGSSESSNSSPENVTPLSASANSGRFGPASPGSSPVFSYFFNQPPSSAPSATHNTFPFRKFGAPVPIEESLPNKEPPVAVHARRASTAAAGRFAQPQPPVSEAPAGKGTGLLRRLSMSTGLVRSTDLRSRSPPNVAPPAVASPPDSASLLPFTSRARPTRSATLGSKPCRAPSPMGERILKGHFDGFN